ncbi:hypothetical protein GOODEAATRI_010058, partial [Goodea atripinnis]
AQESQSQGIQSADDAAEHENMKAVLKTGLTDGESSTSTVPGLRSRTRGGSLRGQSDYSLMKSWRGLFDQPLRGPARGRYLARGDDPDSTGNPVGLDSVLK